MKDCQNTICSDPPKNVLIESVVEHEQYDPSPERVHNDIALIRLVEFIEYTNWILPICMPLNDANMNEDLVSKKLTVAGWGKSCNCRSIKSLLIHVINRKDKGIFTLEYFDEN